MYTHRQRVLRQELLAAHPQSGRTTATSLTMLQVGARPPAAPEAALCSPPFQHHPGPYLGPLCGLYVAPYLAPFQAPSEVPVSPPIHIPFSLSPRSIQVELSAPT